MEATAVVRAGICKMPQYVVAPPPKSQYELERDARIKRNEEYLLSIGINPRGGTYMKQNKKARTKRRARKRVRVVDDLSEEQRAALAVNMDAFGASASASFTKSRHRRDGVITSSCTHRWMEPDARAKTNKCTAA